MQPTAPSIAMIATEQPVKRCTDCSISECRHLLAALHDVAFFLHSIRLLFDKANIIISPWLSSLAALGRRSGAEGEEAMALPTEWKNAMVTFNSLCAGQLDCEAVSLQPALPRRQQPAGS